jgi:hypothetical protein
MIQYLAPNIKSVKQDVDKMFEIEREFGLVIINFNIKNLDFKFQID